MPKYLVLFIRDKNKSVNDFAELKNDFPRIAIYFAKTGKQCAIIKSFPLIL